MQFKQYLALYLAFSKYSLSGLFYQKSQNVIQKVHIYSDIAMFCFYSKKGIIILKNNIFRHSQEAHLSSGKDEHNLRKRRQKQDIKGQNGN